MAADPHPSRSGTCRLPALDQVPTAVLDGRWRGRHPHEVIGVLGAVLLYRYGLRVHVGVRILGPRPGAFEVAVGGVPSIPQLLDGIRRAAGAQDVVVRTSSADPLPPGSGLCIDVEDGRPVAVSMASFSAAQTDVMARCLARLWSAFVAAPATAVSSLPFTAPGRPNRPRPAATGPEVPPVSRVEEHARLDPERPAVSDGRRRLTYGGLVARAARLGAALRGLGVGRGTLVGLTGAPSADLVVAIVALHRIAAAYVPLDPANPDCRLRAIAADSGLGIVLDCGGGWSAPGTGLRVVRMDDVDFDEGSDLDPVAPRPTVDDLAYVLYTSGSTGSPKGVLVSHGNMARLFTGTAPSLDLDSRDTWTLFHSYAFDFSVWEIWGALVHGGRLVVVPYAATRDPLRMLELLVAERVTVLSQTPSAFAALVAADGAAGGRAIPDLRLVIFGGELLDYGVLARWVERHPLGAPRLVNMYGITETTVHVTLHEARLQDLAPGTRTIGRPLPDLRVHLLDEAGALVPDGAVGEMWIEGPGVARGYLGRPETTRERFFGSAAEPWARRYRSGDLGRRDAEGLLEFYGRVDDQVKIRGYRIELGEVETAVRAHPGVRTACVAVERTSGRDRLVAYVVAAAAPGPSKLELFTFVRRLLPLYMVPQGWRTVPDLPLTINGKVDRTGLARYAAALGLEGADSSGRKRAR